jgi:hypothetical protein
MCDINMLIIRKNIPANPAAAVGKKWEMTGKKWEISATEARRQREITAKPAPKKRQIVGEIIYNYEKSIGWAKQKKSCPRYLSL